ncbi:hypothetical protein tinsulaeT_09990 [Thalassotalea insulae]|uniref:Uncharacterized protein n=1 Tax=Thalassotalea insulae TaxID=2056778 RepID=A0ABQ6GQN9_9GAMM|nr:hypothetical protein [Thalassotalea insulae]GLX77659.1 hypothetical protein tinsulaeT_09990 [Thalassotalea insulae]
MIKGIIVSVALLSASAHAEFIVKDWKVPGDGLIIEDTVSQLEWLSPSVTMGSHVSNSLFNVYRRTQETVEPGYEFLNYDLIGWRIANHEEMSSLFIHSFPSIPEYITRDDQFSIDYPAPTPVEAQAAIDFVSLFKTANYTSSGIYCRNDIDVTQYSSTDSGCSVWSVITGSKVEGLDQTIYGANVIGSYGKWLVRGTLVPDEDTCPSILTEMTRQQAIEYIEHLSSQLTDPNATVITPLDF